MRKFFVAIAGILVAGSLARPAAAQQVDVFGGLNTTSWNQLQNSYPDLKGGVFPSFGVDFLLLHQLGLNGEVAFRAPSTSAGTHPTFFDVNLDYIPLAEVPKIKPEILLGLGSASFGSFTNTTNYQASNLATGNHLDGHIGLGLRLNLMAGFFIRPEAHFYFIRHGVGFSKTMQRYGISLGYTFGGFLP